MILQRNSHGRIFDPDSQHVYEEILGGIGYGDATKQHYRHYSVCVGGRREDGVRVIFDGFSGGIEELSDESVRMKDQYLCARFILPPEPRSVVEGLRNTDGLCDYERIAQSGSSRLILKKPPSEWEHFRGEHHTATLSPVPGWLRGRDSFQSAVQKLAEDLTHERVLLLADWLQFERLSMTPWGPDKLSDSALHAAVYALELLRTAERPYTKTNYQPWYRNPGKE